MLKDKPTSLTDCIQACAVKVFKDATSPLSKLKNFQSTVETKTADFKKLSNKFLFGGEVYIRPCATKSKTKWKRLHNIQLYEELNGYFQATITREFDLDMPPKGAIGAAER